MTETTSPAEIYAGAMNHTQREEQYAQFPAHWQPNGIKEAFFGTYRLAPGELPKMNAEIKAEWVKALRSGDFFQIKKSLKATNRAIFGNYAVDGDPDADKVGYCCLGVLAELGVKAGELDGCKESGPGLFKFFAYYTKDDGTKDTVSLPQLFETMPGWKIQKWAGLEREIDGFLASANDNGATFAELADFIDAEL